MATQWDPLLVHQAISLKLKIFPRNAHMQRGYRGSCSGLPTAWAPPIPHLLEGSRGCGDLGIKSHKVKPSDSAGLLRDFF